MLRTASTEHRYSIPKKAYPTFKLAQVFPANGIHFVDETEAVLGFRMDSSTKQLAVDLVFCVRNRLAAFSDEVRLHR